LGVPFKALPGLWPIVLIISFRASAFALKTLKYLYELKYQYQSTNYEIINKMNNNDCDQNLLMVYLSRVTFKYNKLSKRTWPTASHLIAPAVSFFI
jgi:hypothetical protein